MPAPSASAIVENPAPLNPPVRYPLPVLPFPGRDEVAFGDLYNLAGDRDTPEPETYEPGSH